MKHAENARNVKRYYRSSVIVAAILMVLAALSLCALVFRIAFPARTYAFMTDTFGIAIGFAAPGQTPPLDDAPPLPVADATAPRNPVGWGDADVL